KLNLHSFPTRRSSDLIEKKKGRNSYKYYYYYSGGMDGGTKKIGVAVADDPKGPFVDSGKPLIDFKPEGIHRGQEIDPDVFTDPKDRKSTRLNSSHVKI